MNDFAYQLGKFAVEKEERESGWSRAATWALAGGGGLIAALAMLKARSGGGRSATVKNVDKGPPTVEQKLSAPPPASAPLTEPPATGTDAGVDWAKGLRRAAPVIGGMGGGVYGYRAGAAADTAAIVKAYPGLANMGVSAADYQKVPGLSPVKGGRNVTGGAAGTAAGAVLAGLLAKLLTPSRSSGAKTVEIQ